MRKELGKILEDEKFVKELLTKETREEAKKAIEKKGVSVTDEEMDKIYQFYSAIYEKCKTMSMEDLDKISGGEFFFRNAYNAAKTWLFGDSVEQATGGLLDKKTLVGLGITTAGAFGTFAMNAIASYQQQKHETEMADKQLKQQELALQDKQTDLMIGGVIAAGVIGTGYLFKKEIRSWIGGGKKHKHKHK